MRLAISLATAATALIANGANPDVIKPIKDFTPPPPYTPNIAQSAFPAHQFDHTNRSNYFFVTDLLDNSMDKFHVAAGFYGRDFYSSGLFKYRGSNFYSILNANFSKGNHYKDGSGKRVDHGYARQGQSAILGFVPSDITELRFTFVHDNIDDEKEPHHEMDSTKTERYVAKVNARIGDEELGNTLNLELGLRDVSREANNFKLRNLDKNVKVELDRKIFDAEIKYDADFSNFHNLVGVSYQHDNHEGKRYQKQGANWRFTGYRFADVKNERWRIFDTLSYKFNEFHKLSLALNYDWLDSKLKAIDGSYFTPTLPPPMAIDTVRKLIKQIYGIDFDGNVKQDGLSASLKYDFTPNEKDNYSIALESLYRMPDNMERFNTLYGPDEKGWISNPLLKPERHNRAKAEFKFGSEAYKSYLNSMYNENSFALKGYFIADDVDNLIIYDRRHRGGMNGNAVVTRNVDAKLFLANIGGEFNFAKKFGTKLDLFYSYGENDTDDRPLYQIRPFEANWQLDYRDYASFGSFNLGTAVRYVAKQTRGDWDKNTGFGIDKKEAAKSFTTMDVYGAVEFKNKFGVRLGVNNVFDKNYAEFISGNHIGALSPTRLVNAPGRAVWLSFHASF